MVGKCRVGKSIGVFCVAQILILLTACGGEAAVEKVDNATVEMTTTSGDEGKEVTTDEIKAGEMPENEEQGDEMSDSSESILEKDGKAVSTATASFGVNTVKEEKKELELVDYGWYILEDRSSADEVYVKFCAMIRNPNTALVANFPKVNVTVKNADGMILTTDSQTGSCVMPEDTVTLIGMTSVPAGNLSEDTQITFDAECSDFAMSSYGKEYKTTDFTVENVSEQEGKTHSITGEVTNNTTEEISMVNLSIVLRKEGKIVYMDNTYLNDLAPGKAKAFEVSQYHEWPEHDTIDISVQ